VSSLGAVGEGLAELTLGSEPDSAALGVGGDAANVCVMAARLGSPARLLGRVGDDALGARLTDFWTSAGVDLTSVRTDPDAPTGLYLNESGPGGPHRFTYLRTGSAGSRLGPEDLESRFIDGLGVLVVTGITLAVSPSSAAAARAAIGEAKRRGITIACALNYRPVLPGDQGELAEVASESDIVVGSREDLEGVFGDAEQGLARLDDRVRRELVITDGPGAATVYWPGGRATQPVPAVEVRNAAGAGDAFTGAYLASRLQGHSAPVALARGVAAGTQSVQRDGCALSYPSAEETARAEDTLAPQQVAGPVGDTTPIGSEED